MTERTSVMRLAFRVEGHWWVCYCAKPDTMRDAIQMARVAMGLVRDEDRKQRFMDIMKDALGDFMEERFGQRPETWETESGPESERSGSA